VNCRQIKGCGGNFVVAKSLEEMGCGKDLARLRKVCYLMHDVCGSDDRCALTISALIAATARRERETKK